ncbi:glycosyltransferase [Spirillospora sp. NPDC047279]|uniref:glycosyltransferase family 4 protein n=1 Tax=Spirillospora sp. NPDC047279 TaxID=3155478 RepID=UPI00340772A3
MSWAKTFALTAQVAARHLRTEPARTPLLALRILPKPVRTVVRGILLRGGPVPSAYGLWDLGRHDEALHKIEKAAAGARPRRIRRLAAFAVAVERPETAGKLIAALPPDSPGRLHLVARLAAKEGRLSDGIAAVAPPLPSGAARTGRPAPAPVPATRQAARLHRDLTGRRDALTWTPPPAAPERSGDAVPGRVLHIVTNALPTTNAGYTVRTHKIATAQREAGLDPHVVTRLGFPVAQGALDPRTRATVDGVPYHRLVPWRLPPPASLAFLEANVKAASHLVERLRPAVLHAASNHVNAQIALALRAEHGIPVVYEVRGFLEESWLSRDPRRTTDLEFYRLSRDLETACMRAADLVVTLGGTMRDEIAGRGVPADRIVVIPNAVDEEFLKPLPDGGPLRAELGIGPGEKVVGTTTSFYGYEGLDTLLEAGAELRRNGHPVRLLLVGDGPERPALQQRAADIGLSEAALFPGRVPPEDVRRYHAVLDAFVVPRRDERVCRLVTPLKPLEAMAGGVPVVASDLPALREIIEPGATGQITAPNNPGQLAEILKMLLYSSSLQQTQHAAQEWVRRERTWRAGTDRLRDAYRSLNIPC